MKTLLKNWKSFRTTKWLSTIFDLLLILAFFSLISWYMNRDSLASQNKLAPDFNLQDLNGQFHRLSDLKGKKVLLYFFAPWCKICSLSSGNLNDLRESSDVEDLEILIVGLSYENPSEVVEFANKKEFTSPVLLGSQKQIVDYEIKGFPTYFVIDEEGRVTHRSIGYSTEIGMRIRT